MNIVIDTNCIIASLSRRGRYFNVWKGLRSGLYTLCVSNEILEEYEEVLQSKTNIKIADNVIQTILNLPNVKLVNPQYRFNLITDDPDDNKFVDCAIAANAAYIVSNDRHFDKLRNTDFPKIEVIRLEIFSQYISVKPNLE